MKRLFVLNFLFFNLVLSSNNESGHSSYLKIPEDLKSFFIRSTLSHAEAALQNETLAKKSNPELLNTENNRNDFILLQKSTLQTTGVILFISLLIIAGLLFSHIKLRKSEDLLKQTLLQQKICSNALITLEEKERLRIARDLHDGIGQQLSAAKLNISALQSFLKVTHEADKILLQNTIDLLDDSVKEVRNASHKMIPNSLIKNGLESALPEFINKLKVSHAIKINFEIVGFINRFEQTKEAVVYRVVQEVVTNCIKHASASEVSVQIVRHEKELSIVVHDNGLGFDTENVLHNQKVSGLKSMQSRMDFLNGNIFFDSRVEKGTTVTIEVPV